MAVPPARWHDAGLTSNLHDAAPARRRFRAVLLLAVLVVAAAGVRRACSSGSVADRRGEADEVQAEREEVMAQAEQFVLRIGTYGPDQLDDQGTMPEYRDRVTEVITPKFADRRSTRTAAPAEQLVAQTASAARPRCLATGVAASTRLRRRAGGRRVHDHVPGQRRREASSRAGAVPLPASTLVKIDGKWLVDDFEPTSTRSSEPVSASLVRPARRRPRRVRRRDPGGLEVRDRRPRPGRPAVPRLQPGRRGAARPRAAGGVRRRARRRGARAEPSPSRRPRRSPRPSRADAEPDARSRAREPVDARPVPAGAVASVLAADRCSAGR